MQGLKEAQEQAQAAVQEGEDAVAQVRKDYKAAMAEVEKLVKERQRWQDAWDEEREHMEADKAALAASMEVSCQSALFLLANVVLCPPYVLLCSFIPPQGALQ